MPFSHLRRDWEAFKASPPGQRFQDVHKRREQEGGGSSTARRILLLGLGLVLTALGLFFLFVPGPGTLVLCFGIALIARQSLFVARGVDRLELWLRPVFHWLRQRWRAFSSFQRVALSVGAAALACLASLALYFYAMR